MAIWTEGKTVSCPILLAMIWSSEVPFLKSSASVRFGALPVSQVPALTAWVPCGGRSTFETTFT